MLDVVEELEAGFEGMLAFGEDEVVVPLRADLADALLANIGAASGKGSGDLDLRGVGGGVIDLSAKVDTDAAFVEEVGGDRCGVAEAEDVVVGLRVVAGGKQGCSADADVREVIDVC